MSNIQRFVKNPVEVDALQWDDSFARFNEMREWTSHDRRWQFYMLDGDGFSSATKDKQWERQYSAIVWEHTHSAWLGVKTGDWIVKGLEGEFYPCDPATMKIIYKGVG